MKEYVMFWGILFIVLTIIETQTVQLISIWLGLSALATMFVTLSGVSFTFQVTFFVVLTTVLLILTRPLAKKLINSKVIETNYERDIGKTCTVIEPINNALSIGRVTLDGVDWSARSFNDAVIEVNSTAIVEKIDGSKLIVRAK